MPRTEQLYDRVGVELPANAVVEFICCDCALVHRMVISTLREKVIGFAVEQDLKRTEAIRARKGILKPTQGNIMAKKQANHVWSRLGTNEFYSEVETGRIVGKVTADGGDCGVGSGSGAHNSVRSAYADGSFLGQYVNVDAAKAAVEAKLQ